MDKEIEVLNGVAKILMETDRAIVNYIRQYYTEEEIDDTKFVIYAYAKAWDAMIEVERLRDAAEG